tara:strand:- start:2802 stop:2960 length:159 start_codon:yes stop_codon:yes gene_type:complete
MERDNVIYMPAPKELTPDQREHWENYLEQCERGMELALRMLGRIGVEKGLEG